MRPDVHSEVFQGGSQVRVGSYYSVAINELEKGFGLTKLTDLDKHCRPSAEFSRHGIWQSDGVESRMIRQRNPGKDTIGDLRVSYRVLTGFDQIGKREVTASVCGIPNGNKITNWHRLTGSVCPGSVTSLQDFIN